MTKKMIVSLIALGTIVSFSVLGVGYVRADENSFYHPLVSRIAERFNLSEEDVEAVFDAVHEERHLQMQENKEAALDEAVADGVITEEQKQLLLQRHQQMWGEMKENRQAHMQEMESWCEENGIDHQALREYFGQWGGRGGHKGMHRFSE